MCNDVKIGPMCEGVEEVLSKKSLIDDLYEQMERIAQYCVKVNKGQPPLKQVVSIGMDMSLNYALAVIYDIVRRSLERREDKDGFVIHKENPNRFERKIKVELLAEQLKEAQASPIKITCKCCERKIVSWAMFRCYYCGLWFCLGCAPKHFGGPRPKDFLIEKVNSGRSKNGQ